MNAPSDHQIGKRLVGKIFDLLDGTSTDKTDISASETVPELEIQQSATTESDSYRQHIYRETGLSPEEYLLLLVERNGGRMSQQRVVKETEWSAAAVSRNLSDLEEAGQIERIRFGREKMVYLPGKDPTDRIGEGH